MPVSQQYFVLFHREGRVYASTLPSYPATLSYGGKRYSLSRRSLIEFNHLIRGGIMAGFDFLSPEDGGKEFLASQFVQGSANVRIHEGTLEIVLGTSEDVQSDQGAFMPASLFQTAQNDFLIVLPCLPQYWSGLGFELITDGGPTPDGTEENAQ